jgi:hypothetical protein
MSDDDFEDAFRSHHQAAKTTDEPLIRVMALHALACCERLAARVPVDPADGSTYCA